MDQTLKEAIKAAVLNDEAPDIIEFIDQTIEEESDRLMKIWYDSPERQAEDEAERKAEKAGRWEQNRKSRVRPVWMWWSFFRHSLEYVVRDMREQITQRGMTEGEIDKIRKKKEIARARRALADAESGE